MNARPRRTAVSLGLLFGVVYGLGAAPCGCWEHSGWRAAIATLAASRAPAHPPIDADRVVDDECHGGTAPSALPAERLRLDAPDGQWMAIGPATPLCVDGNRRADGLVLGHDYSGIAPPVRAQLQVFRL